MLGYLDSLIRVGRNGMIWGMDIELYGSLNASEKKRGRNRVSARAFRAKRKGGSLSRSPTMVVSPYCFLTPVSDGDHLSHFESQSSPTGLLLELKLTRTPEHVTSVHSALAQKGLEIALVDDEIIKFRLQITERVFHLYFRYQGSED